MSINELLKNGDFFIRLKKWEIQLLLTLAPVKLHQADGLRAIGGLEQPALALPTKWL